MKLHHAGFQDFVNSGPVLATDLWAYMCLAPLPKFSTFAKFSIEVTFSSLAISVFASSPNFLSIDRLMRKMIIQGYCSDSLLQAIELYASSSV